MLVAGVAATLAHADTSARVGRIRVATGLRAPVYVTAPSGEPNRLYIVEQRGVILAQERDGRRRVFLDIRRLVLNRELAGLFSVAFDPQYSKTGRLFVDYVGRDFDVHVDGYRASGGRVSFATREELLHVVEPIHDADNHFGGQLAFGPDGMLYVGVGDGSTAPTAQDPSSLLGKLVRLDIHDPSAEPETVGFGLRNPWRFSFDRKTGDLYVGDVGANTWEEIDRVRRTMTRPVNFGWPLYEARARTKDAGTPSKEGLQLRRGRLRLPGPCDRKSSRPLCLSATSASVPSGRFPPTVARRCGGRSPHSARCCPHSEKTRGASSTRSPTRTSSASCTGFRRVGGCPCASRERLQRTRLSSEQRADAAVVGKLVSVADISHGAVRRAARWEQ